MIPESFIEELKYHSDIEQVISSYVNIKRAGRHLKGLCPFHSEKSPSFTIYPESQSFYCFGCGAGGDVVNFVKRAENIEYIEALRMLAQRAGMTIPEDAKNDRTAMLRSKVLEINRETARFYYHILTEGTDKVGLAYLRDRGLTDKTIKRFGLGYAPESWDILRKHLQQKGYTYEEMLAAAVVVAGKNNSLYDQFRGRIIFPIIDLRGNVIGFGGRIMEGGKGPKYLNSPDTLVFKKSRNLFALNIAKATKQDHLILAEGYMDVISVQQAGFDNVVATLGTALTQEQSRLISQYTKEAVIAYDADAAGQAATKRAVKLFDEIGIRVRVLSIPDAKDPDEYIKKFGAQRFKLLIEGSANAVEFEIKKLFTKHNTDIADGKVNFLKEFCYIIADLGNIIQRDVYISKIAVDLSVSKEALESQVTSIIKQRQRQKKQKEASEIKVFSQSTPSAQKDIQRTKNIKFALAEDKLLQLLLKNPDYEAYIKSKITPKDFVTDSNREIFSVISDRLSNNLSIDMTALSSQFDDEQMSKLSWLTVSSEGLNFSKSDADDYISTILSYGNIKTDEQIATATDDDLKSYIENLASKKK